MWTRPVAVSSSDSVAAHTRVYSSGRLSVARGSGTTPPCGTMASSEYFSPAAFASFLLLLQRLRPIHITAWLRFTLNSIPTAQRLHDGLSPICPLCLDTIGDLAHVLTCSAFDSALLSLFEDRRFTNCVAIFKDYVLGSGGSLPLTFAECIARRLGLFTGGSHQRSELHTLRMVAQSLFLRQFVHASLRRRIDQADHHSVQRRIVESLHAALISTI